VDNYNPDRAVWVWNFTCRFWGAGPDGTKVPVFAGLPFIRLEGPATAAYGIHGPVTSYTLPEGGRLRRGYVSHGCVRMEAQDVLEVSARLQGRRAPVRLQQAVERAESGAAVDIEDNWLLSECVQDADCAFEGGLCRHNIYSGRGFCTARCDGLCPDRFGYPQSFCVSDPAAPGEGMCTYRPDYELGRGCRRFEGFVEVEQVPRHGLPEGVAAACMPGSEGWIGDPCFADNDCDNSACLASTAGERGFCTLSCVTTCADRDATYAKTACVKYENDAALCHAECVSDHQCPVGTSCQEATSAIDVGATRKVCLP